MGFVDYDNRWVSLGHSGFRYVTALLTVDLHNYPDLRLPWRVECKLLDFEANFQADSEKEAKRTALRLVKDLCKSLVNCLP